MIYLCAGVYAEGRSDYAFLLPLTSRMLFALGASISQATEVADSVGIDAARPFPSTREARIAGAIQRHAGQCTLFVIHADAGNDAEAALRDRVRPGQRAAGDHVGTVACIPVREIEAWMLSDPGVFTALMAKASPALPRDPEAVGDPKQALMQIFEDVGLRGGLGDYYRFFGENVDLACLRRLPAFCRFEAEMKAAVLALGHGSVPSARGR